MGVPTEPLSKLFQKESAEKAKAERLRTEGFEDNSKSDNYERFATEESKEAYDFSKRKQNLVKKAEVIKGKGLAPPPGWNIITSDDKNGHNPDYIDLLSGSDEKENNVQSSNESTKASPSPNLSTQPTTLLDDLLSMDMNGSASRNGAQSNNYVVPTPTSTSTGPSFVKNSNATSIVSVAQSMK
jgi:hypothetical protein